MVQFFSRVAHEIHTYSMVSWDGTPYHIPLFPIPCHLMPYNWNDRGIPHSRASHTIIAKLSLGVWGSFLQNIRIISAGVSIGALGSILCGHVLQAFAGILSYKWRLYSELHPLKISSIGLYPRVCCGYSTTSYLKLYILPWPFN